MKATLKGHELTQNMPRDWSQSIRDWFQHFVCEELVTFTCSTQDQVTELVPRV